MKLFQIKTRKLGVKEAGASLVEYGLLLALIAVIAIPSVRNAGRHSRCALIIADVGVSAYPSGSGVVYRYPIGSVYTIGPLAGVISTVKSYCLNPSYDSWFGG